MRKFIAIIRTIVGKSPAHVVYKHINKRRGNEEKRRSSPYYKGARNEQEDKEKRKKKYGTPSFS